LESKQGFEYKNAYAERNIESTLGYFGTRDEFESKG
jgi:hypothetical protein